jgi:glycine/D-amino acid oxidase-like deaminating enzyme
MGVQEVDYLVVGFGIAGAMVAEALHRRERTFRVVDLPDPNAASRVAAGLITPVSGRNFVLRRDLDRLRPAAVARYSALETELDMPLLRTLTLFRAFEDPDERSLWEAKRDDPEAARFVGPILDGPPEGLPVHAPFGGVPVFGVLKVEVQALLDGLRAALGPDAFVQSEWRAEDCRVTRNGVTWKGIRVGTVICCEGAAVVRNPWFSAIPWEPARGDSLVVAVPGFPTEWIASRGVRLAPLGEDRFYVGATYNREHLNGHHSSEGRAWLERKLERLLACPYQIQQFRSGVRPMTRRRVPVVGLHPERERIAILNGLGSAGTLSAPHYAQYLIDTLESSRVSEDDIDPAAHWPRPARGG